MSDSLKATVIVILDVLTISTRPELLVLALVLPRLPALVVAVVEPALLAPALELEPELLDELDTWSPGEMLCTNTTVPLAGAYRWVSWSAVSAVVTLACAPSTEACAEAMLAALVAAVSPL